METPRGSAQGEENSSDTPKITWGQSWDPVQGTKGCVVSSGVFSTKKPHKGRKRDLPDAV